MGAQLFDYLLDSLFTIETKKIISPHFWRKLLVLLGDIMPVLWNQHDTFRPRQIDCHFQDDIFQRIFLNGRCENFIEICFTGYNWKCSSIVSENGSAPTRRQTIIWTNYMLDNWHIYVALGLSENRNLGISHQFGLLRKIHRARVCQFSASRSLNQWWHFTLENKLQGNWIKMKCITVPKPMW